MSGSLTDRGQRIAVIEPAAPHEGLDDVMVMVREGRAVWGGGKPRGSARPTRIRGKPISDTVLEDRR